MSTWVVGDVQGCKKPLKRLMKRVGFSWDRDQLWSTGDIINRGPECLKTLRFFYRNRDNIRMVLGNHDLHLMAIVAGVRAPGKSDTFKEILAAPDLNELIAWLHQQPLLHREKHFAMVHAGVPPQWSIDDAGSKAQEVEAALRGNGAKAFFENMYGNTPGIWSEDLQGMERLRVITNYLTRMRYCYADGTLDLVSKGPLGNPGGPAAKTRDLDAWFRHPNKRRKSDVLLFGHWASLQGVTGCSNVIALDTGCVWGNTMSLYCLETGQRVEESCAC